MLNQQKIINELSYLIRERRFPYIKCVYVLRNILDKMGGRYKIRIVFEYIPGIYATIIYKKHKRASMPILTINSKLCVKCGNCEYILGETRKRFFNNRLELSEDEAEILKDKINKALDKCHLEALRMEE